MSIEITPELQEHINYLRGLSNITNVVIEPVPDDWKDQINNVDSVLFKIYKNEIYMDLVVPNLICYGAMSEVIINQKDSFDSLINVLINKMAFDDCVLFVDNEKLETFFYLNAETGVIGEVENVISKNERTTEQEKLIELLHTVEFVREVFLYEIVNNSDHLLLACNIVNLQYSGKQESCPLGYAYCPPHGTRYKVLLSDIIINDVDLHQNVVDDLLKWYETTVNNIEAAVYSSEHEHHY